MTKLNWRNYAMVSHISGARGAGAHENAHNFYRAGKAAPAPENDSLTEEEMTQEILRIIAAREGAELRQHFISNFAHLGRRSDILACLDALHKFGKITVMANLRCNGCGAARAVSKDSARYAYCTACDCGELVFTSEFFLS